jgi:hypothetical protein
MENQKETIQGFLKSKEEQQRLEAALGLKAD